MTFLMQIYEEKQEEPVHIFQTKETNCNPEAGGFPAEFKIRHGQVNTYL